MKIFLTIGRSRHCDIIIPNESVSREHGRIYAAGDHYVYENLGKNGASLNGRIISSRKVAVTPGANIILAGCEPLPWAHIYAMLPLHGGDGRQSLQRFLRADALQHIHRLFKP